LPFHHLKYVSAKLLKCALATREDNDLLVARLPVKRVKHSLNPIIVRINQCVVQNHWGGAAVLREQT
jgi:hypothetical protein